MLMDLFVSTSSEVCGEAGKGWAVLTFISLGCNFTPQGRTLGWREIDSLLQKVCEGKKSFWNNLNSMVFFCWRGTVKKIHSSLMNTRLDLQWALLVASKMRKFTSVFYKVVNYSGNILLQSENVIFTRLGFVFLGGTTVWSCRIWIWGHMRIWVWFSIQFLRFLGKGCNMCFGIQACNTLNVVFKMV